MLGSVSALSVGSGAFVGTSDVVGCLRSFLRLSRLMFAAGLGRPLGMLPTCAAVLYTHRLLLLWIRFCFCIKIPACPRHVHIISAPMVGNALRFAVEHC